MNRIYAKFVCSFVLAAALANVPARAEMAKASVHGRVTDPSESSVPNALVVLRGASGPELKRVTDLQGQYSFTNLAEGKYTITVTRKGFAPAQIEDYAVKGDVTLDFPLVVALETQKVTVEDQITKQVSVDPNSNASALVLHAKDLEALSDDPDQLQEDLQALAGPSAGPNGGQIYIDGFTGGRLPPKASIREVRINQNPFSAEYDRLGFGRIEIFTKPGTDKFRGQFMTMFGDNAFNARNPLVSQRPDFQSRMFNGEVSGPLSKRASFSLDAEHRGVDENAVINATVLNPDFTTSRYATSVPTPQERWHVVPRIDIQLTPKNSLTARYGWSRITEDNQGVGNFSLPSRAYNTSDSEHSLRLTETAVLSPNAINETRFEYRRDNVNQNGDLTLPAIDVLQAFVGGSSQIGQAENQLNYFEFQNTTSRNLGRHSWKFGGRLRSSDLRDVSPQNFGGTFTFTTLERYRETQMLLARGLSPEQVSAMGYGANQFQISGGNPLASVKQVDVGVFLTDDWKARPNLTLSYGLRYENQTNLSDWKNFAPRVGIAWGIGGGANKATKTVLRAGSGVFYDRLDDNLTLQAIRYNGVNAQQYVINNPDFYPSVPSPATLATDLAPIAVRDKDAALVAPRIYQTAVGIERQLPHSSTVAVTYTFSRGVHMLRTRDINAPIKGVYPYASVNPVYQYESTGTMRQNQIITNFSTRFSRRVSLFGFYMLNWAKSDTDGVNTFPANSYDLSSEWGSSAFDVRHRVFTGGSITAPWHFMLSPFVTASSGMPFNIVSGKDLNGDGIFNDRPAFADGAANAVQTPWGAFLVNPGSAATIIPRNYGRGPGQFSVNMRLARTWGFGRKIESSSSPMGGPGGPPRFAAGAPPGPPRGGGGMGRGGPGGMFGDAATGRRFNLTLGVMARNIFNFVNLGVPVGNLSSPLFGQSTSLAGGFGPSGSSSNRRIDLQLRLSF